MLTSPFAAWLNMVETSKVSFSIPSLIAVVAALLSFAAGAFWGFILALVAIAFGVVGILLSLAPSVRGGFVSVLSMGAGVLGIIVATMKTLFGGF